MAGTEEILNKYKNYKPEVVTYDESVDGGLMLVREKHLDKKEALKSKFDERLKKVSTGKTAR